MNHITYVNQVRRPLFSLLTLSRLSIKNPINLRKDGRLFHRLDLNLMNMMNENDHVGYIDRILDY